MFLTVIIFIKLHMKHGVAFLKVSSNNYNLNSIARMILLSDLTRSGLQLGSNVEVEKPVWEVTPPLPAK